MKKKVRSELFNTPFEMSLRISLLLSSAPDMLFSLDRLLCLDFIVCYASEFGFPYDNLQGDNDYKYGEMVGRRILIQEALKDIVIRGLVNVSIKDGYVFSATDVLLDYSKNMESDYAEEYREIAEEVTSAYISESDNSLLQMIQNESLRSGKEM